MARLRSLMRGDLSPEQGRYWDEAVRHRPKAAAGDDPVRLVGPSVALLRAPAIAGAVMALNDALQERSNLGRRLLELAICTVAAKVRADFAFWRHAPTAIELGISPEVIDCLRAGTPPHLTDPEENLVHRVVEQVVLTQTLDPEAYAAAVAVLGEERLVELVVVVGYFAMIGAVVRVFDVEVPDGSTVFPVASALAPGQLEREQPHDGGPLEDD